MIRKRMIGAHVNFGDFTAVSSPETACQFLIVRGVAVILGGWHFYAPHQTPLPVRAAPPFDCVQGRLLRPLQGRGPRARLEASPGSEQRLVFGGMEYFYGNGSLDK